jgi:hypothetical protein
MTTANTFFISVKEIKNCFVENETDLKEAMAYFQDSFCIAESDFEDFESAVQKNHQSLHQSSKNKLRSMVMAMRLW